MTMADKIVVMRDGCIEQMGSPLALYDQPENLFVPSFIGSPAMNLIGGRIAEVGAPRFVTGTGLALPLKEVPADSGGRAAVYGIRPEHFVID
jgi:multiple sugar transport system ATP-binding protein